MTRRCMKTTVLAALLLVCARPARAQTGPSVKPGSLSFVYQLNSATLPASVKLAVTLPAAIATLPIKITVDRDWLIVTPGQGYTPLSCTASVNVYGLTPGTYPATITVDTTPTRGAVSVPVVLSISNPPASLLLNSSSPFFTPATSLASAAMSFAFTTGGAATSPSQIQVDVSSSGDSIPFDVTATSGTGATAGWLRVSLSPTIPPAPVLHTSASVLLGGAVFVYVTVDPTLVAVLDVGSYAGQISIVDSNNSKDAKTVLVNLVITAGQPSLRSTVLPNPPNPISPFSLIANPKTDPVITIYGDNFFLTSVVTIRDDATVLSLAVKSQTLLSRQVLQVTIPKTYFVSAAGPYPWSWTLYVTNPDQTPVSATLLVTDPNIPGVSAVFNAASFLQAAKQTGTNADPVATSGVPSTVVCPREIISIFGQNLGPADVTTTTTAGVPLAFPTVGTGINGSTVRVLFLVPQTAPAPTLVIPAPIIMTSANQINAIVPESVNAIIGSPLTVVVESTSASLVVRTSTPWSALVLAEDPGQFTFGGLGQGQAAVLNYDSTGATSINSSKNAATRGLPISIYATGLGDIVSGGAVGDGEITTTAIRLTDVTTRVEIDGQPVVVTYAGTSPGSVPGLTQINAIVPPTVRTGPQIPITVAIGTAATRRRSQLGVYIAVK
ncbi:MAG: hypothetical protein NTW28_00370 [Candidatus Solibacter sp.]|nr:hypothetical protein [Candidatus Solibacter sp.]